MNTTTVTTDPGLALDELVYLSALDRHEGAAQLADFRETYDALHDAVKNGEAVAADNAANHLGNLATDLSAMVAEVRHYLSVWLTYDSETGKPVARARPADLPEFL